jgi:MFS family permease
MTTPDTAKRVAMACLVGTAIEWYDFFIYGTASALILPKLFFPSLDPAAGALLSYSTFALAFIVRPIGGLIFGHFGDRVGRKALLVTTVILMGTATTLIGLLPTYASIGVAAPLLLVVLRVLQGISVGGEYGGAVLMAVEHSEPGRRGYRGSWVQMGSPAGLILANAAFLLVTQLPGDALLDWGWRIPFLLGSVLLIVGLIIRLRIPESPRFEEVKQDGDIAKVPALVVLRDYPGRVLLTAGAYVGTGVVFYGSSIFGLSYGVEKLGFTRSEVLAIVLIGQVLAFFAMPVFATLPTGWVAKPFSWRRRWEWQCSYSPGCGCTGRAASGGASSPFCCCTCRTLRATGRWRDSSPTFTRPGSGTRDCLSGISSVPCSAAGSHR